MSVKLIEVQRMRSPWYVFIVLLVLSVVHGAAQSGWIIYDSTYGQPFRHWEATADVGSMCDPQFATIRDRMLDSLVAITGVNRLRVEVRSGAENPVDYYAEWRAAGCPMGMEPAAIRWRTHRYATVNDNADTTIDPNGFHFSELDDVMENIVLPLKRRLAANGKDLLINVCYVANTFENDAETPPSIHTQPEEYAEFMVAVYQHLVARWAITPDGWEAVYEPDKLPEWTADKLGAALQAAVRRAHKLGYRPNCIVPSTSDAARALEWTKTIVTYPDVRSALRELSYHRTPQSNDSFMVLIRRYADSIGVSPSMLHAAADSTFPTAMIRDLEWARANSWNVGTIAEQFIVARANGDVSIARTHTVARHGILSRFVVPGTLRVAQARAGYCVVMRTPQGMTIGYQNPFIGDVLDDGWPQGSCYSIQIDSLARERSRQWIRTAADSGYLQVFTIGKYLGVVITITPPVVSVHAEPRVSTGSLRVVPQPTHDVMQLALPDSWTGLQFSVRIEDLQGRQVYASTASAVEIDPHITPGWYIVECRHGDMILRTPCVVE